MHHLEEILKGSKLNTWSIKKARKAFQMQVYLGLRYDDICMACWIADETTHGETEATLSDENFYGWNN